MSGLTSDAEDLCGRTAGLDLRPAGAAALAFGCGTLRHDGARETGGLWLVVLKT